MKSKSKIIGATLLVLAGVGIWVPQLPAFFSSAPAPTFDPPAEMPLEPSAGEVATDPDGDASATGAPTTAAHAENDPLARIEALFGGEKDRANGLQRLAQSWRDDPATDARPSAPSDPGAEVARTVEVPAPPPLTTAERMLTLPTFVLEQDDAEEDPFARFLEEHPLSGLLVGARRVASFGPYVVVEGDELPGDVRLLEIHERHVVVERDGRRSPIALPPFRTRARAGETLPGADPGAEPLVAPGSAPAPAAVPTSDERGAAQ